MSGKEIDASQSQGLIYNPQADVGINQHYGDRTDTNTGGGDLAGRDVDKRNISQTFNIFVGADSSSATHQQPMQQLAQILGQMGSTDSFRAAYQDSLPTDASISRPDASNYGDMLAQLQEFRRLSEFVVQLAGDRSIPQSIREQLEGWIQQSGQTEPQRQKAATGAHNKLQSYLQIVLTPDLGSNGFLINGWLIPDDSVADMAKRFRSLDLDEDQKGTSCSLEEVPDVLDRFLQLSFKMLKGRFHELTIEVFLPLDYLCADVDQWKLTDSFFDDQFAVGTKHRMVVRSQERLEPRYLFSERMNQWYDNWNRVRHCWQKAPSDEDFEHLQQLTGCNWKQLEYALADKLGLKLTCGLTEAQNRELFRCILKAAAPIAIWTRCDRPHWDQITEMNEILLTEPLSGLSTLVFKKRKDADVADNPEECLGSHLALLWEDPYRLTPDAMAQLIPTGE
jgi:hypothetical protein